MASLASALIGAILLELVVALIFLLVFAKRVRRQPAKKDAPLFSKGALLIDMVNNFASEVQSVQRNSLGWLEIFFTNGYRFPYNPKTLVLVNKPMVIAGAQPILIHGGKKVDQNEILAESQRVADAYLKDQEVWRLQNLNEMDNIERMLKAKQVKDDKHPQ